MKSLSTKLSVGAIVAIATAGVVMGAIVARALVRMPTSVQPVTKPEVVVATSNKSPETIVPRKAQGEQGNASRMVKEEAAKAPTGPIAKHQLSSELAAAIRADKWLTSFRYELHQQVGVGALYKDGKATQSGQFVIDTVSTLEEHGLSEKGFGRDALNALLTNATDADHEIEAALGLALTRLTLVFHFFRRAGPFKITRDIEDIVEHKKKRREVLKIAALTATAQTTEEAEKALWPVHPLYRAMKSGLAKYKALLAQNDCSTLPETWRIRPGANGASVGKLAERLRCEGFYSGPPTQEYNDLLLTAVKLFQRTHDLGDDGFVFEGTIRSMNVPMKRRAEQITLAMQRFRESRVRELGDYYVYVNVPAFLVRVYENGKLIKSHRAIVGTNRLDDDKNKLIQGHLNRTKLFTTRLYEIVVNPDWILPERIQKGELVQKVADDPDYLKKQNIKKITLPNGREVLVQRRGSANPLGHVKFLLKRSRAIFLHDTDKKDKFKHQRRDFSHGCVRVDEAVGFANFLLLKDGWDRDDAYRTLYKQKSQRGMKLKRPVPLVTEYSTVDISAEGLPVFLSDIYGYDKAYAQGKLPPREHVLWGRPRFRPSWVPLVPEDVVKKWRSQGKPAPRNYNPAIHGGG